MKIEVHSCVHEKPQAGNQGAHMIGKASRIAFYAENLPSHPKKEDQKDKPAKTAENARFGEGLYVIIMTVIHDEAIIRRFVERKDFLQGSQSGSQGTVILKNTQAVVQHFRPAPLACLQFFIGRESVECGSDSEPRN